MNINTMKWLAPVLGVFGDNAWHYKEETYPILTALNSQWTPTKIDYIVKRYLEYGLLRMRKNGKYVGHPQIQITEKGSKALDSARLEMIGRKERGYSVQSPYSISGLGVN